MDNRTNTFYFSAPTASKKSIEEKQRGTWYLHSVPTTVRLSAPCVYQYRWGNGKLHSTSSTSDSDPSSPCPSLRAYVGVSQASAKGGRSDCPDAILQRAVSDGWGLYKYSGDEVFESTSELQMSE